MPGLTASAVRNVPTSDSTLTQRAQMLLEQARVTLQAAYRIEGKVLPPAPPAAAQGLIEKAEPEHIHWALESLQRTLNELGEALGRVETAL